MAGLHESGPSMKFTGFSRRLLYRPVEDEGMLDGMQASWSLRYVLQWLKFQTVAKATVKEQVGPVASRNASRCLEVE